MVSPTRKRSHETPPVTRSQHHAQPSRSRSETRVRIDSPACRICYEGTSAEKGKPIVACNCKASFAFVHRKCISDWLQATDAVRCDICQFEYIMKKKPETFNNWCRTQEKGEEYKLTIQTAGLYFFNLIVAAILFYATYGSIVLIVSFFLAGCTMFWAVFLTGSILVYVTREIRSFRDWRSSHFRIEISPNPKPDGEVAAPAFDLARAAGLSKKHNHTTNATRTATTTTPAASPPVAPSPPKAHPSLPAVQPAASSSNGLKSHPPRRSSSHPVSPPAADA